MTRTVAPQSAVKPPKGHEPTATAEEPPEEPVGEARTTPEPQPPRIKVAALMGLAHQELTRVMGVPGFKRVEDPAALWQYRGARCILDVYLYADGPVYRVTHLEFRRKDKGISGGTSMKGKDAERCFSSLVPGTKKRRG